MEKLKRYIIVIGIALLANMPQLMAQFDGQLTQYMFNASAYNPGAIGLNSDLNVKLHFREQWTGFKNAPSTFNLQANAPIRMGNRVNGIGLLMINESIGLFKTQWFQAQYAHKFNLWQGTLSAGVQAGLLQQNFDASGIYIPSGDGFSQNDAGIPDGDLEGMIPDLSLGLWYERGPLYAGLSCSHLIGGNLKLNPEESTEEEDAATMRVSRTIYFTGGYNISLKNPLFTLQPSFLLKSDFVAWQADLSAILHYNKQFWGGVDWRPGSDLSFLVGMNFEFGLSIGYSFDASMQQATGSHEIMIGYRQKIDTSKINKQQKSIRLL